MCDTMCFISEKAAIFGKNSDRDPGELQLLLYTHGELQKPEDEHPPYLNTQFRTLEKAASSLKMPYPALLSCPSWIWGAEMGINTKGVAIGNEAVFSRRVPRGRRDQGLLGMDILRLALHCSADADEAVSVITGLIEQYGQGGNGSRNGRLYYQNSFLIIDGTKAVVLETSGSSWASREIYGAAAISNAYSLRKKYDASGGLRNNCDVKMHFEHPVMSFFSKGDFRRSRSLAYMEDISPSSPVSGMKEALRSHLTHDRSIRTSMKSLCVHARGLVNSKTTASMIADYRFNVPIVWVTGSPCPCLSLFKPLTASEHVPKFMRSRREAYSYAELNQKRMNQRISLDDPQRRKILEALKHKEDEFDRSISRAADAEADELSLISASCFEDGLKFESELDGGTSQH